MRMHEQLMMICLCLFPKATLAAPQTCNLDTAVGQIYSADINRRAHTGVAETPLLAALEAIADKAPSKHLAITDQISPRDAARFAEIADQIKQMRLAAYVESAHARDALVTESMFNAAWKSYTDPQYTVPSNDVAAAALMLLRIALPKQEPWLPPLSTECSIDMAIATEEQLSFDRINSFTSTFKRDFALFQQMKARYGTDSKGELNKKVMPSDDIRIVEAIMVDMHPLILQRTLLQDLQNIRAWWSIADLVYRTRKEDVATYASWDHLGDTLQPQIDRMSEEQKVLLGIWRKIDERVKSDEQQDMNMLSKAPTGGAQH
jgi:hypothetical protein